VIEWEHVLTVAAEGWGEENMTLARLDLAGPAFLPALTIIEDAAWYLAQRGVWDEPDEQCFVALRACHLAHRRQFIAAAQVATRFGERDQPSELAEWFIHDLQEAHWTLIPEADCGCGTTYKVLPGIIGKPQFSDVNGGPILHHTAACDCGRPLADIDTGAPGQLRLDLGVT
jgi:hypothetical protein